MPETALRIKPFNFINKPQLIRLKLKAIRAGVWFKALQRIDRVLIDLTIRVASNIRSVTLARNILAVTKKLEGFLESRLSRAIREVGLPLAKKISQVAQKWGNTSAENWASDLSFVNFFAAMSLNEPRIFKA